MSEIPPLPENPPAGSAAHFAKFLNGNLTADFGYRLASWDPEADDRRGAYTLQGKELEDAYAEYLEFMEKHRDHLVEQAAIVRATLVDLQEETGKIDTFLTQAGIR